MNLYEQVNEQLNFELESAYIYRTMAAYLDELELGGFANFMDHQVKEEVEHADAMKSFLQSLGQKVKYRPIDPGKGEFESVLDVFKKALEHEKLVTKKITEIHTRASEENNPAVRIFLDKFIMEQVEEEETFSKLVTQIERVQNSWAGLYQLNAVMYNRQGW